MSLTWVDYCAFVLLIVAAIHIIQLRYREFQRRELLLMELRNMELYIDDLKPTDLRLCIAAMKAFVSATKATGKATWLSVGHRAF